jgi:hypothetical protein
MENRGPVSEIEETAESEKPESKATRAPHPATDVAVGDQVRMRKSHPCGSFDWRIVRVGADIGMRCLGCDHRVNLSRAVFERRFKTYLARANAPTQPLVSPQNKPH